MRGWPLVILAGCVTVAGLDELTFDDATGGGAGSAGGGGDGGSTTAATVFTDDDKQEFDQGSYSGTEWRTDAVILAPGSTSGVYRSRVFDAGYDARWTTLAWTPRQAYGVPLPGGATSSGGYPVDIDMSDNVLLLTFDELEAGATSMRDTSGNGNDAVIHGPLATTAGVVGLAFDDDIAGYASIDISANSDFQFGITDVTWMLWVNTTHPCPSANPPSGNRVYLGAEEGVAPGDGTHLWLGCSSTITKCSQPGDETGRAGGTFRPASNNSFSFCSATVINDGSWHHLALTKSGHPDGIERLYVDGALELEVPYAFIAPLSFESVVELAIGAFSEGTFPAAGAFDEVAIFRRALSDKQIRAIHRRAGARLSLRARACQDAACGDDPPWSDDLADDGSGPPSRALGDLRGRYLQYEASFSGIAAATPELLSVSVTAAP